MISSGRLSDKKRGDMFPCKQMDNTDGYRNGHEETFGETDIFKNLGDDADFIVWDESAKIPKEKK